MRRTTILCQRLAYEILPAPTSGVNAKHKVETMVFLHGIMGNKKNLRTLAKEVQKLRPHLQAVLVDHRGHGDSIALANHAKDTKHTVEACAQDLQKTLSSEKFLEDVFRDMDPNHKHVNELFVPDYLCAHSFGGKVALQFFHDLIHSAHPPASQQHHAHTQNQAQHSKKLHFPKDIWILDSSPYSYPASVAQETSNQSVAHVLQVLTQAPKSFPVRSDAEAYLTGTAHLPQSVAQWLTASMTPVTAGSTNVTFTLDMPVIQALFQDFLSKNYDHFLREVTIADKLHTHTVVHMVRAEKNTLWNKSGDWDKLKHLVQEVQKHHSHHKHDQKTFRLPLATHEVANVGHWLHAEQPQQVAKLLHDHSAHTHHNLL